MCWTMAGPSSTMRLLMVASRGIVYLLALLLVYPKYYVLASSASTPRTVGRADDPSLPQGLKPDTFVTVAPLVVAAECKDGVAIVATHTTSLRESLLVEETEVDALVEDSESNNESKAHDVASSPRLPRDLPLTFRGPFRIQTIDGFGTTLACAGWRTDGETLAAKCRALAASELERFGDPTGAFEYGRFLAEEAHSWMAQCAVSDNVRALSCLGLLSTGGSDNSGGGCLWLIDATGAYHVRAHAVGLGASEVNKRLLRIDFSAMTTEECARALLQSLVEQEPAKDKEEAKWKLPIDSYVEVATVVRSQKKLNRLRLVDLLHSTNGAQ